MKGFGRGREVEPCRNGGKSDEEKRQGVHHQRRANMHSLATRKQGQHRRGPQNGDGDV